MRGVGTVARVTRESVTAVWGIDGNAPTVAEWKEIANDLVLMGLPEDAYLVVEPDTAVAGPRFRVALNYDRLLGA